MEIGPQTADSSNKALALQMWEVKEVHTIQLSIQEYMSMRILPPSNRTIRSMLSSRDVTVKHQRPLVSLWLDNENDCVGMS